MRSKGLKKTTEQRVAKRAFDFVNDVMGEVKSPRSEYRSYVRKLPSFIQINGLLTTIAFYFSKVKKDNAESKAYELVLNHVREHLIDEQLITDSNRTNKDLLNTLVNLEDVSAYRRMTSSIVHFAMYLSRFAEGLYDEKKR